jgi:hypothetical protein
MAHESTPKLTPQSEAIAWGNTAPKNTMALDHQPFDIEAVVLTRDTQEVA